MSKTLLESQTKPDNCKKCSCYPGCLVGYEDRVDEPCPLEETYEESEEEENDEE